MASAPLRVAPEVEISGALLSESFVRASGPGGQNVNKVNSAVELRFDMSACKALSEQAKARLAQIAGRRLTVGGEIVIFARSHREQERNRAEARERLREMIERSLREPKVRKKSKLSRAANQRRLDQKRRDSAIKSGRSERH